MAKIFSKEQLPHWHSTRDTRDRLDLVTENVPVPATRIRADRIIYHPGDTAAKHYHTDCYHLFYILSGQGILHADEGSFRVSSGVAVVIKPNEVHWFENDTDSHFSFVEFWAPPPKETVWITDDR